MIINRLFITLTLACIVSACATTTKTAKDFDPELSDTLSPMAVNHIDYAFADQALLSQERTRLFIEEPKVEFSSYFLREHRLNLSQSFLERTSKLYAKLLKEELSAAFSDAGYTIESDLGKSDTVVKPRISELNIYAPDDHIGKSFTFETGNALLVVTFADQEKDYLLLAEHRETNTNINQLKRTNQASNANDFKRFFKKWAEDIVKIYAAI